MAVAVVTRVDKEEDRHAAATLLEVKDGHLVVHYNNSGRYQPQALYAPGTWIKAVLDRNG